jgi:predicted DNA-binding transcriptional regulator YafY
VAPASIRDVNATELRTTSLPPVTLTPEEAAAVAVALAAHPDGPYAAAGGAALEKVLGALEPDPQQRARLLATSRSASAAARHDGEVRATLERGLAARKVVALRYRDGQGRVTRREVEPQLLARDTEHWFVVAWCRERQALRWFRADRVEGAELTEQVAPRRELTGVGAPPASRHPAGRALRTPPDTAPRPAAGPPRLVVLPGGRA